MTPEKIKRRKRVAELLYPNDLWDSSFGDIHNWRGLTFSPDFSGDVWERSQALAVVEWLAAKLMNEPILDPVGTKRGQVMRATADKDIESLMQMVLEVSGD